MNKDLHEGCVFDAPHQHCADGGIYFPFSDAVLEMIHKMKGPSIPLSEMADMLEKFEAEAREKARVR